MAVPTTPPDLWIGLSGVPAATVLGVEDRLPYASATLWCEMRWEPEHVLDERRGGVEVVLEPRWRLVGRLGYEAATEAEARVYTARLPLEFDLAARTRQPGDPEWAREGTVRVRRTSPVEATTLLIRRTADGRPAWRTEIAVRGVATTASADSPAVVAEIVTGLVIDCVEGIVTATWDTYVGQTGAAVLYGYLLSWGRVIGGDATTAGPPYASQLLVRVSDVGFDPAAPSVVLPGTAAGESYAGVVQVVLED